MSIRAMIARNPHFQAMKARDAFTATNTVKLQNWQQLDAASWWCEEQWRYHGLHYRRRVRAGECEANFEFADEDHAFVFLLRFGSGCRTLNV